MEAEAAALLRQAGAIVTLQRLQVLQVMVQQPERYMTLHDVHEALQADNATVLLTSVYQTLQRLQQMGVLEREPRGPRRPGVRVRQAFRPRQR